jgi:hypothetical protein
MALDYTAERVGELLAVRVTGSDEGIHEVRQLIINVVQDAFREGVHLILCDETEIVTRLDTLETFEIGTFLSSKVPPSLRIAIVYNPASLFDFRFFESLAVNRGLKLRIFIDHEDARRWLVSS